MCSHHRSMNQCESALASRPQPMQPIPYGTPIDPAALENLADFAVETDRDAPPTFVGRGDVIDMVGRRLRGMATKGRSLKGAPVVCGPPGAGKTALVQHLAEKHQGTNVVPVVVSGEELASPRRMAAAMLKGVGLEGEALDRWRETKWKGGLRSLGSIERTSRSSAPSERIGRDDTVWDVVGQVAKGGISDATVFLVLVDECQRVTPDVDRDINQVACQLNDGNTGPLKVLPVFAGLSNTPDALSAVRVSRTAEPAFTLGPLKAEEARQAVAGFFQAEAFGVREAVAPGDQVRVAEILVKASERYPRHLHCYLRGLAREFSRGAGVLDLDRVLDHGHELRLAYNAARCRNAALGEFAGTLAAAAQATDDSRDFTRDGLFDRAGRQAQPLSRDAAAQHIQMAIGAGLLEISTGYVDRYRIPIPSMRRYIASGYDAEASLREMREQCGQDRTTDHPTPVNFLH